jgi:hypothetical protein
MAIRKLYIFISITISGLLLSACGSDDSASTSAPAPAPVAESTPAPSSDGEAMSMDSIEKAEGVVYQDEIYANWPYN